VLTNYDAQGRVSRIESPEGIISYEYDLFGRRTKTMIGEASNPSSEKQYRYDSLGRLIGVDVVKRNGVTIDNDPGTTGDQPETTSYQYDLLGNLDRTDLPNGRVAQTPLRLGRLATRGFLNGVVCVIQSSEAFVVLVNRLL
jgi:YD repeat-containing protein